MSHATPSRRWPRSWLEPRGAPSRRQVLSRTCIDCSRSSISDLGRKPAWRSRRTPVSARADALDLSPPDEPAHHRLDALQMVFRPRRDPTPRDELVVELPRAPDPRGVFVQQPTYRLDPGWAPGRRLLPLRDRRRWGRQPGGIPDLAYLALELLRLAAGTNHLPSKTCGSGLELRELSGEGFAIQTSEVFVSSGRTLRS